MAERSATATWNGSLSDGDGSMAFGSGAFEGAYSAQSRFEEGEGTNPEELIGAAHAGCFSMALAGDLGRAGYDPDSVETAATVYLEKEDGEWTITRSHLDTTVEIEDVDDDEFQEIAEQAKETCPVSRALGGVEKTLDAELR
ncbi:OsmC family protein [Halobacterium zhouii]|uniref:OsmC family protein n=1 Tax=Halobacterium zhouii TaxID=2902624 RepID=UPI001E62EE3F|nr:OsmC family protein [Halobacterium zhouii]